MQTIDTFLTSATEALSSRPQTVEEIGVANAKHSELATEKLQVIIEAGHLNRLSVVPPFATAHTLCPPREALIS